MDTMRHSSDFRARQLAMSEGTAQCQKELRPMQAAINDRMLAQEPGLYAKTLRAYFAIQSAYGAGDEPKAFQLARAMDAQTNSIQSEAWADPAHAEEMLRMLGSVQTQIGVGYEKRGNDAEAAFYYQKAIDTMPNGHAIGRKPWLCSAGPMAKYWAHEAAPKPPTPICSRTENCPIGWRI
jgi:hypothetical protein